MSLHKYLERIKFIDSLICRKATGNPNALAKRLNLSRSATLEFIKEMKEQGFPIAYSRCHNSYHYTESGQFVYKLFETGLSKEEMKQIKGGKGFIKLFI